MNDYNELIKLLDENQTFCYTNYSTTPEHNILPANTVVDDAVLSQELKNLIEKAQIIVIIAGMYTMYSRWIEYEFETAKSLNKPIIAIRPIKNSRIPKKISANANAVVSWNGESLIASIEALSHKTP